MKKNSQLASTCLNRVWNWLSSIVSLTAKPNSDCWKNEIGSRGLYAVKLMLCGLALLIVQGKEAAAQQSIAPIASWSNTCNVPGDYKSGQEVCDARRSWINWGSALTFVSSTDYLPDAEGRCAYGPEVWQALAFPYNGFYCPAGFAAQNVTNVNSCGGGPTDHLPHFKGANATCVRAGIDPGKNAGSCSNCVGNPINAGTANKYQIERDFTSTGKFPLSFERIYNSIPADVNNKVIGPSLTAVAYLTLGQKWRHSYDRSISFTQTFSLSTAAVYRPDGKVYYFNVAGTNGVPESDIADRLQKLTDQSGALTGWSYTTIGDSVELYDATGKLLSITNRDGISQVLTYSDASTPFSVAPVPGLLIAVTDSFGRALGFSYDSLSRLTTMTDPQGGIYQYAYDSYHNLSSVTYPDNSTRTYLFENSSYPTHLTGITDEAGNRFATYSYDSSGRAISSQHSGGADNVSISYGAQTVVTDALNASRTYSFQTILGVVKTNGITQPASSGSGSVTSSTTYDANGNIASKTDFNGNATTYQYDLSRNLETSRTEASGTRQARTITTSWHATYRLPTSTSVYASGSATGTPIKTTSYTYDSSGNQLTKTITDPATSTSRTWTYTYNSYGQVLTADGPRTDISDITTYTYYSCTTGSQCGQVQSITNALGQTTTYPTYNVAGQPLTITDPNGVVTTLTYDARQRLTSRTVGSEVTAFAYTLTGLLQQVTLPNGSYLTYTYDAAHRLTQIQDADGNKVVYTLDAAGNHTAENLYDPNGTLKRTHTTVFNALSQLYQDINAANTAAVTTSYGYDSNGNQTTINAPLTRNTSNQYDALSRVTQVTDPAGGIAHYGYDANDNLVSVTDPRGLVTSYTVNGLGDLLSQLSPDTGTTLNTYDSAGNLKTRTDARGQVTTFQYDALNRLTQQSTADQTLNYQYDQGTNGKGHLTTVSDANHSITFAYDPQGRVIQKSQSQGTITHTTQYAYTNGDLTQETTPSGQVIAYSYTHGKVTSVALNGTTVLNQIQYDPFGPITQWTWGNGTTSHRSYDQDGYLTANQSAGTSSYTFNPDGSIATQINDSSTSLNLPTGLTTFTVATSSNRLASATGTLTRTNSFDAAGNLTSDGTRSFTFNGAGRMTSATNAGLTTSYTYNALGQRIKKTNSSNTTLFAYDERGHLLGEYTNTGALIQELVWLNDLPVATIRTDQSGGAVGFFYLHTDHLNTPRKITRPSDNAAIWRWDSDPYGNGTPNEDPDGNGLSLAFNFRFPGQYYDSETGLNYNMARYYDPLSGRYITSDPIGLRGGINTYLYAKANPIKYVDPTGEIAWWVIPVGILAYEVADLAYDYYQFYQCVKKCPTECSDGNTGPNAACKAKCTLEIWAKPDGPGPKWPVGR